MADDIMICPKCGSRTNRFAPACEHCYSELPRSPARASDDSIEAKGHALHESLDRSAQNMKKCPYCAEMIRPDAIKCRYCGERIKKDAPSSGMLWTFLALAAITIMLSAAVMLVYFKIVRIPGLDFPKPAVANMAVPELSEALRKDPAKAGYVRRYVTLTGTGTLEETDSKSSSSSRYAYGTINNTGDRLIIRLGVTIYCLDKNGRIQAEILAWPVFGVKGKPDSVKPGSSRDFRALINNTSPDWTGRVKLKVSDIELAD